MPRVRPARRRPRSTSRLGATSTRTSRSTSRKLPVRRTARPPRGHACVLRGGGPLSQRELSPWARRARVFAGYLDSGAPTLKHQRSTLKHSEDYDQDWYKRGYVVVRPALAARGRPGASSSARESGHQRARARRTRRRVFRRRATSQDQKVTKFRKGACENCGAMTHTAKTCTERPRRHGAKVTGSDIKVGAPSGSPAQCATRR